MSGASEFLDPRIGYRGISAAVCDPLLEHRVGRWWWTSFVIASGLTLVMIVAIVWLFVGGVGVWGIDTTVIWGFAIANYVWWIGIGNAGTLISCLLLLTRQQWRASVNRFAEAMTLFAAAIAGLFPIFHLGRPEYFYWLFPYPNTMGVWPQWRSPLVWDFFAIASYILFSLIFWYVGLIPDLSTCRLRARSLLAKRFFCALSLGWRGSARDWRNYEAFYWTMAGLGVPLVVSVHSVVGLDFAAGLMPGWAETIFPPYFVVGAMFSGFAMVAPLAVLIRWGFGLHAVVTAKHLDMMGRFLLFGGSVMGISYLTEWFFGWYGGDSAERRVILFEFTGAYAPFYWTMLTCNVLLPQLFWFAALRRNPWTLVIISFLINLGMWLERILIVVNTLSRGHLPAMWELFWPTVWDWALLLGSLGFFALLYLLFVRVIPTVSMHEVRRLAHSVGQAP